MPISAALQPMCVVLALMAAGDEATPAAPKAVPPAETSGANAALTERLMYPIRHGSAFEVASVLDKFFKGSAEVQALPEKVGNCLLIRYRPDLHDELLKTLSGLDQPPKTVQVDVLLIDLARKKEKAAEGEVRQGRASAAKGDRTVAPLKEEELVGPTAEVIARLDALVGSGEIGALRKIRVATLENQQANAQSGREVSMPSNFQVNQQTGRITPILQRRSIGTIALVTPRVISENEILLDVTVREDQIYFPEDGKPVGEDKNGPVFLPNVSSTNAIGKISVTPGRTLVLQQLPSDEKGASEKILILIAAEVVSSDAKAPAK